MCYLKLFKNVLSIKKHVKLRYSISKMELKFVPSS